MNEPSFERISSLFSTTESGRIPDEVAHSAEAVAIWKTLEAMRAAARAMPVACPDTDQVIQREEDLLAHVEALAARDLRPTFVRPGLFAAVALLIVVFWGVWTVRFTSDQSREMDVASAASDRRPVGASVEHVDREDVEVTAEGGSGSGSGPRPTMSPLALRTSRSDRGGADAEELVFLKDGAFVFDAVVTPRLLKLVAETDEVDVRLEFGSIEATVVSGRIQSIVQLAGRADVSRRGREGSSLVSGETWSVGDVLRTAQEGAMRPESSRSAKDARTEPSGSLRTSEAPLDLRKDSERGRGASAAERRRKTTRYRSVKRSTRALDPGDRGRAALSLKVSPDSTAERARAPAQVLEDEQPHEEEIDNKQQQQQQQPEGEHGPDPAAEEEFRVAWRLLERGESLEAAHHLERIRSGPLAEDALFWRGVALGRAGADAASTEVLERYIARYPHSRRVPEARVAAGLSLLRRGDKISARAHFRAAASAGSRKVREAARRGLLESAP